MDDIELKAIYRYLQTVPPAKMPELKDRVERGGTTRELFELRQTAPEAIAARGRKHE